MISLDEELLNDSLQFFTKMRANNVFPLFMQVRIEGKGLGEEFKVIEFADGMLFTWSDFPVVLVLTSVKRIKKTRKTF